MYNWFEKKQPPILYTVGGVIRTIAVPYMQYFTKNDLVQQPVLFYKLPEIKILIYIHLICKRRTSSLENCGISYPYNRGTLYAIICYKKRSWYYFHKV